MAGQIGSDVIIKQLKTYLNEHKEIELTRDGYVIPLEHQHNLAFRYPNLTLERMQKAGLQVIFAFPIQTKARRSKSFGDLIDEGLTRDQIMDQRGLTIVDFERLLVSLIEIRAKKKQVT